MGLLTNLVGGGLTSQISKAAKRKKGEGDPVESYAGGAASYKKGGKVRKTGLARLHKGEYVLTKAQAKRHRKSQGK